MWYDRGDSFPSDFKPNGIPFGSKFKVKLSWRSYPIQYERKRKYSFLSGISCLCQVWRAFLMGNGNYFVYRELLCFLMDSFSLNDEKGNKVFEKERQKQSQRESFFFTYNLVMRRWTNFICCWYLSIYLICLSISWLVIKNNYRCINCRYNCRYQL